MIVKDCSDSKQDGKWMEDVEEMQIEERTCQEIMRWCLLEAYSE